MDEIDELLMGVWALFRAPPDQTVSQWADANRRLSSESSPEPFAWRTSRAEYQRGIMDAFSDPRNRRVVVESSAQVGKTSIIENVVGFHIDQDPSPILVVEPTLDMGETMSKDRFAPMFRDTAVLRGKIADARSRDSGNTLLHKSFPGGHLTIAGANSPASLAMRPIRVLLCDDIDRFPVSAGPEGNPIKLAIKRTNNFWNRRIGLLSTPTDEDVGIDAEYKASDRRRFFVACPDCKHEQTLEWRQVQFVEPDGRDAKYVCPKCGVLLDEQQRDRMVAAGVWRATAEFRGVAGFHINELYTPWRSFADIAIEFLESKDDPEKLRVWVNTALGEAWKPDRGGISADDLEQADGLPKGEVPREALALTLGVDTQGDRLALQLVGWGKGDRLGQLERWTIDHLELPGDPNLDESWDRLTEYRRQRWAHLLGGQIGISIAAVDSGGHHSQRVVAYAREHRSEGVIAVKGSSHAQPTILKTRPTRVDYKAGGQVVKKGAELWMVGTDAAKSAIDSLLRAEYDRRKIHFASGLGSDFFRQLTAEVYDKKLRRWVNPKKRRNEALDTLVYATAATMHPWLRLDVANAAKWAGFAKKLTVERDESAQDHGPSPPKSEKSVEIEPKRKFFAPPRRGNFVTRW
ncbi:MAG: phage terminase large subunit family protein [Gemmatimonadaceae bacterium]